MDSSSNHHQELEQVEAIDNLLEDFWFYDNLFDRRSRILRYCHSDPCPFSPSSSSSIYPIPTSGSSDSDKKLLEASTEGNSIRAPCTETKEGGCEPKKINKMRMQFSEKIRVTDRRTYLRKKELVVREKGTREDSVKNRTREGSHSLQRTQTLPSYIGRKDDGNEFEYQESDDSRMGFLIREAIGSSSPGFTNTPKVSSIPRHRPPRSSRSEEAIQELVARSERSTNLKTLRKTLSNIETKEILKLKDVDSETEKQGEEEKQRRIPCGAVKIRSVAVIGQPIPVWVAKDSARDMKTQIKFWARTVASNVRQEC